MKRLVSKAVCALPLAIGVLVGLVGELPAQEERSDAVGYRRVFVPAGRPEAWPAEGQRFLPVEQAELDRLLRQLEASRNKASARIDQIRLTARYDEQGRLTGLGSLRTTVAGSSPAFIPWPNRALKIRNAEWKDAPETPVLLGSWFGDNAPPEYGLVVPASGVLQFQFELATADPQRPSFRIPLPTSIDRSLTLELPPTVLPKSANALVSKVESQPTNQDAALVPWRVLPYLGEELQLEFQTLRAEAVASTRPFGASTDTEYRIAAGGVECRAVFSLLSDEPLPAALWVETPEPLAVIQATVDGVATDWRSEEGPDGARHVVVDLSRRDRPRDAVVALEAWRQAPRDENWLLPVLKARDGFWREGTLAVRVDQEISVVDLPQIEGAVIKDQAASEHGEPSYQFQLLRDDPAIAVRIEAIERQVLTRINQVCELSDAEVWSTTKVTLSGETFRRSAPLVFVLQPEWLVESIEAEPLRLVEDWYQQDATPHRPGRLIVQIDPVAAAAEETLTITCRRAMPRRRELSLTEFSPLSPTGVRVLENRLRLTAADPYSIAIESAADLPAIEALTGVVLEDGQAIVDLSRPEIAEGLNVVKASLRRRPLLYDAEVSIEVVAQPEGLAYQGLLAIDAQASRSDTVLCFFDRPLPGTPRWFDERTGAPVDATRLIAAPATPTAMRGEMWSVRFPSGAERERRIVVATEQPWQQTNEIPFLGLPGARRHTGRLTLCGPLLFQRRLDHSGLTAEVNDRPNALGYRFDPERVLQLRDSPRLAIDAQPADQAGSAGMAQVRLAGLDSVWTGDGFVLHASRYERIAGAEQVRFGLPANAELLSVTSDAGRPLLVNESSAPVDAGMRWYVATEPEGHAASSEPSTKGGTGQANRIVTVAYRETLAEPDRLRVGPLLPECGVVGGAWEWRLALPDGMRPAGALESRNDWRFRLFGPLAQEPGYRPFNPLRRRDWVSLLAGATNPVSTAESALGGLSREASHDRVKSDLGGWNTHRFTGADSPPPPVRIEDARAHRAAKLALQIGLMAAAIGWLTPRRKLFRMVVLVALLFALIAPQAWSPWASAIWFGVALAWPVGLALRWFGRWSEQALENTESLPRTAVQPLAPMLLVPLLATSFAFGDEPPPRTAGRIEPVLIPVDEEGTPVGDKRYVGERFLKQLLEAQQSGGMPGPTEVLVEGIGHRGELLRERIDEPLRAGRWVTTLRLRTFKRGAEVVLPLDRAAAEWPDAVQIDGVPAQLQWDGEQQARFIVPDPGPCVAVLHFEPKVIEADGESCVQLRAPLAPAGELQLDYPAEIVDMRVPFAERVDRRQSGKLRATLPATGDLLVCWTQSDLPPARYQPTVDLFQWVHIDGDSAELEVQLTAPRGAEGVLLQTPAGWESLDEPGADSVRPKLMTQVAGSDSQRYRARYQALRESQLGAHRTPLITTSGATVRRRLAALSVADGLRQSNADSPRGATLDPTEFVSQWVFDEGADKEPPAPAAATVLEPGDDWTLRVEPEQAAQKPAAQQLSLAVGDQWVRCQLLVDCGRCDHPIIPIEVNPAFEVAAVVMRRGERQVSPRWTRPAPERLVVFPGAPLPAGSKLELTGRVPRRGADSPAPRLAIAGPEAIVDVIVYREDNVLVQVTDAAGELVKESDAGAAAAFSGRLRPVAAVAWDFSALGSLGLAVQPNRPSYDATITTTYEASGSEIEALWSAEIRVREGRLGHLPVATLRNKLEGLELTAPDGATLVPLMSRSAPRWRIDLGKSVKPGESLRVEARMTAKAASGGLPAPLLSLPAARATRAVVATPVRPEGDDSPERLWRVSGLEPLGSGSSAHRLVPPERSWRLFGDQKPAGAIRQTSQGRVYWGTPRGQAGAISIPLAEHRLLLQEHVESVLETCFAINPKNAERCFLRIGPRRRLASVTIDGTQAVCRKSAPGLWEVELRSPEAPQVLRTVLVGPPPGEDHAVPTVLSARRKEAIPETALWSVRSSADRRAASTLVVRSAPLPVLHAVRLRGLQQLASSYRSPTPEWVRIWSPLVEAALVNVRGTLNLPPALREDPSPDSDDSGSPLDRVARQAEQWLESVAEVGLANTPGTTNQRASRKSWFAVDEQGDEWSYFVSAPTTTMEAPRVVGVRQGDFPLRSLIAFGLVASIIAGWHRLKDFEFSPLLWEYRHGAAAIGGVAWWLCLQPSFIGLVILAASAIGQALLIWRRPSTGFPG